MMECSKTAAKTAEGKRSEDVGSKPAAGTPKKRVGRKQAAKKLNTAVKRRPESNKMKAAMESRPAATLETAVDRTPATKKRKPVVDGTPVAKKLKADVDSTSARVQVAARRPESATLQQDDYGWSKYFADEPQWKQLFANSYCRPEPRNQEKFRDSLVQRGPEQCLLTKYACLPDNIDREKLPAIGPAIEAAHIIPWARWDLFDFALAHSIGEEQCKYRPQNQLRHDIPDKVDVYTLNVNSPENGVLLRSDIHILFDYFFWSIHRTTYRVIVLWGCPN
jgi:hypothetical protein